MELERCDQVWGRCEVRATRPVVEVHDLVTFVPMTFPQWGVFDKAGHLVQSTGYVRGPDRHLPLQSDTAGIDVTTVLEEAPDNIYIYGGAVHPHFGHFILSTLCRLWAIAASGSARPKIIWHTGSSPAGCFAIPFIGFLLGKLGLKPDDFVVFDRPVVIRRMLVPQASFEELNAAHIVFAELCNHIGDAALYGRTSIRSDRPAYISKTRLSNGVWRVANEDEIVNALERNGIDIVYPEQLALADQIALFSERRVIAGWVGSGFHTSVFARNCARLVAISSGRQVTSNYLLLDRINHVDAAYYWPSTGVSALGASDHFSQNIFVENPVELAESLLHAIDSNANGAVRRPMGAGIMTSDSGLSHESLDSIGLRHGTDKASFAHNYLVFYERFFAPIRFDAVRLLEIGVYSGSSLRMWQDYFPSAAIVGVDITPEAVQYASPRIAIETADQSNVVSMAEIAIRHGPFDIVIDDGSHVWDHQIASLQVLFPFVKPGGYYVLEDIDTSYGTYEPTFKKREGISAAKYLQKICDYVVSDVALPLADEPDPYVRSFAPAIESMSFYRRTCVIKRKS